MERRGCGEELRLPETPAPNPSPPEVSRAAPPLLPASGPCLPGDPAPAPLDRPHLASIPVQLRAAPEGDLACLSTGCATSPPSSGQQLHPAEAGEVKGPKGHLSPLL